MKRIICSLIIALLAAIPLDAQKKPTIMILPSDNWCTQRYFMQTYDNQGIKVSEPDYVKAFREDTELTVVISKLGELMTGMGYSLKDAETEMKAISARVGERNATYSTKTGSEIFVTPLDEIKMRTKVDIVIQIWWKVNKEAKGNSISFTLEAFDSYTSKRIATSSGIGKPSKDIVPIMLEKAVKSSLSGFDKQLTSYYNDMAIYGREIILNINIWDSWDKNLETEFDNGDELLDCIKKWMNKNTVNKQFNLSSATETTACFEQIRIPLLNEDGDEIDAREFATMLRKYLRKTYQIESKVMTRGLGEAILVLGEK